MELSFQTQQERREGKHSQGSCRCLCPSEVSTVSRGPRAKRHPETADFFPLSATTCSSIPDTSTQFSGFCVCFLKQGLIKLHGIQKKCTKESNLRPDYTFGAGGMGGINAKWGREYFNQKQRQNKSYNKLFLKKRETDRHATRWTHTYIHTLFTHITLVLVSSVDEGSRAGAMGKDKG